MFSFRAQFFPSLTLNVSVASFQHCSLPLHCNYNGSQTFPIFARPVEDSNASQHLLLSHWITVSGAHSTCLWSPSNEMMKLSHLNLLRTSCVSCKWYKAQEAHYKSPWNSQATDLKVMFGPASLKASQEMLSSLSWKFIIKWYHHCPRVLQSSNPIHLW